MQLHAIYHNGCLEFTTPVRFAQARFAVTVEIPEAAIIEGLVPVQPSVVTAASAQPTAAGAALTEEIRQILGPYYRSRPGVTVAQDKAAYHAELEEKHGR